ncbi:MAG TPA: type I-E CRISPR-associated endonuclease Cas1 [Armatimonadetes bacterium]|nr:type I-E CRISPR-associated endonuclease Cas1 [Armatimonadota bacterium]
MLRGKIDDLHSLPKTRDSLAYAYFERARIDRHEASISVWTAEGELPIPAASLAVLMLGPGTTITHSAIAALAENNCLVVWCGEENVRFYAAGMGGTHSAARLLHQARLVSDPELRMGVVRRMYAIRFAEIPPAHYTIEQLRGMEGARVRDTYARVSRDTGLEWHGRTYDRSDWSAGDPANRALSAANSCLYGLCHAAVLAAGYSPAMGFIHTGHQRSFVLDLADLYKCELTIPLAFQVAADPPADMGLERAVRTKLRDVFRETRLIERLVPDIEQVLGPLDASEALQAEAADADPSEPLPLWTPEPTDNSAGA